MHYGKQALLLSNSCTIPIDKFHRLIHSRAAYPAQEQAQSPSITLGEETHGHKEKGSKQENR